MLILDGGVSYANSISVPCALCRLCPVRCLRLPQSGTSFLSLHRRDSGCRGSRSVQRPARLLLDCSASLLNAVNSFVRTFPRTIYPTWSVSQETVPQGRGCPAGDASLSPGVCTQSHSRGFTDTSTSTRDFTLCKGPHADRENMQIPRKDWTCSV